MSPKSPMGPEARLPRPKARLRARAGLAALAFVATAGGAAVVGSPTAALADASVCPDGSRQVVYDVTAFETVIPVNGWGDHMPSGLTYALSGGDARVGKAEILANPNLTQPFVLRANVGDCVTVNLRNDINGRRVGLNVDGLLNGDPRDSDGTEVGQNPASTAAAGDTVTYTYYADREGEGALVDAANLDPSQSRGSTIDRGLYGAVVVHAEGTTWHNQKTGADLLQADSEGRMHAVETQVFADIHDPERPDWRSNVIVFMDENEDILDATGESPTFPTTGLADSTFGMNYRSEPLRNRLRAVLDHRAGKEITLPNGRVVTPADNFCDGYVAPDAPGSPDAIPGAPSGFRSNDPGSMCLGEESHLQSWPFGDEGKLTRTVAGKVVTDTDNVILKAYKGDPITYHVIHPGAKETHPFHQHTQRWYADPDNPDSPRNDVQSVGPGNARRFVIEGGAGGVQGTIGDSIFHCHLYPHFAQGFWGHLRIFDKVVDGTTRYPDGTTIEALRELPDRAAATPAPTAQQPGFPLFVKGQYLQRAYRIPYAVIKDDFGAPDPVRNPREIVRRPGDTVRGPTPLEAANLPGLDPQKPGAGYIDPCPVNAPARVYRPHAIDVRIEYNDSGWHDPEGRIYVERSRKDAVQSGAQRPQPYTIRSRVGECVTLETTNSLHEDDDPTNPIDMMNKRDWSQQGQPTGGHAFQEPAPTSEVSTHVHLVQFDELGSDGTSVGWNYVQAAMPGQTYGYRWFVDQPLRTVFFHDHQYANGHQQKGLFAAMNVEPADATWHDPQTGEPTDGTGPVADIRSASGPDFREFTVFTQDRSPAWLPDGTPINPPGTPDDYGADQGVGAFNYRNEPLPTRIQGPGNGRRSDPAYAYSSAVHGDPSTPVFKAYAGDPVVIRQMNGAHEEMHQFSLHGHRWLVEPDNPLSNLIDNQSQSLGEYFNYEIRGGRVRPVSATPGETVDRATPNADNGVPSLVAGGAGAPGDYRYASTSLDDEWTGMWGIFRVPAARRSTLQPLPDRSAPGQGDPWPALAPAQEGQATPVEPAPGTPETTACPAGAPVRTYQVSAITQRIEYNENGDHDPNGLMYALDADLNAAKDGLRAGLAAEPLFLRVNAGECIRLRLTNRLPYDGLPEHTGDVPPPFMQGQAANSARSRRVSIHAGLVEYDVTNSDGATVGYNFDQTIAPGQSITQEWYVPSELAGLTTPLVDLADRRGHRHHGLSGALLVEPAGATWSDPQGNPTATGAQAIITWTERDGSRRSAREFVADFQDGLNLRDGTGAEFEPPGHPEDAYEAGERGINYRNERFGPRLAADPTADKNLAQSRVMSSALHGDPDTAVFQAYLGDRTWFRVLQGGDRGRAHTFLLSGHEWNVQMNDPRSRLATSQDGLMPGRAFTFSLRGGAGGGQQRPGDYLFRDGNIVNQVNMGLWGVMRVHDRLQPGLARLPEDTGPVTQPGAEPVPSPVPTPPPASPGGPAPAGAPAPQAQGGSTAPPAAAPKPKPRAKKPATVRVKCVTKVRTKKGKRIKVKVCTVVRVPAARATVARRGARR